MENWTQSITKERPYASTNNPNIEILDQDVHEDIYGFNGQVIFKMRHNQKLFIVSSIHLDKNRMLKNVGIVIKNRKDVLEEVYTTDLVFQARTKGQL